MQSNLWLWSPLLSHHFPKIPKVCKIQGNKTQPSFVWLPSVSKTDNLVPSGERSSNEVERQTPFSYPDPDHSFWNSDLGDCVQIQRKNSLAILTGMGGSRTFQGRGAVWDWSLSSLRSLYSAAIITIFFNTIFLVSKKGRWLTTQSTRLPKSPSPRDRCDKGDVSDNTPLIIVSAK